MKLLIITVMLLSANAYSSITSPLCPGENGETWINNRHRNPIAGGFVGHGTDVAESVFIAKSAAVCGSASVQEKARIYGKAVVKDNSIVGGNAKVFGNAVVKDTASIEGNARVYEDAIVGGDTLLMGNVHVRGGTVLSSGVYEDGVLNEGSNQVGKLVTEIVNNFNGKSYTYSSNASKKFVATIKFDFNSWGNKCIANIESVIETYKYNSASSRFVKEATRAHSFSRLNFSERFLIRTRRIDNYIDAINIAGYNGTEAISHSWEDYSASGELQGSQKPKLITQANIALGIDISSQGKLQKSLLDLIHACKI